VGAERGYAESVESRLVVAMASGDRRALARLYALHAARLVRLTLRILGDRAEAEDVVHDVFVEAWQRANDFDPEHGTARAWLTTRARSRAIDRAARAVRGERAVGHAQAGTCSTASVDLDGHADAGTLRRNLRRLPDELAQLIEGIYYEGSSAQALSERFEIPVGTVKSRLARALAELRERLSGSRGEPAPASD
jgi:RNA polymerase sigma-70 factor (ECF subfamily)